jgi:hypothetical protein
MGRDIVKNLKFKKHTGKHFDPELFAQLLDESYRNTKRADGEMTKKSFSPSSLGYGHGTCPRYWYMAFSGAMFIDDNDAVAVANMAQGTQAHERLLQLSLANYTELIYHIMLRTCDKSLIFWQPESSLGSHSVRSPLSLSKKLPNYLVLGGENSLLVIVANQIYLILKLGSHLVDCGIC